MNEESIIYIINYFNQYKDQPPEVLVSNIISSGYNMNDLKEALRRMGISPIVIPGYKEGMPQPEQLFSKKLIMVSGTAVVVLLIGVSSFILLSPKKSISPKITQKAEPTVTNVPTPSKIPTPTSMRISPTVSATISAQLSEENPSVMMKNALSANDYKVTIISSRRDSANNSPAKPSRNIVYYLNKGTLKRFDSDKGIIIYTDDFMYALDESSNTYAQESLNDPQIKASFSRVQGVFLPNFIISETEGNQIKWQKKSDTIWEGNWNSPNVLYTNIVMTVDPVSGLPTEISTKTSLTLIEESKLEYEKISSFASVLKIPEGYTLQPTVTQAP